MIFISMSEDLQLRAIFVGQWEILATLGEGSYAKVKLVRHDKSGQIAALKIFDLRFLTKPGRGNKSISQVKNQILNEAEILKRINHPNVIKLIDLIEEKRYLYLITEVAERGELFSYVKSNNHLSEKEARRLFRQLISALEYCHGYFIVHRDLKLENLLLDNDFNLKVVDFGFSSIVNPGELLTTSCGSTYYVAPEVLMSSGYIGMPADVWSAGIILFIMLHGYMPFYNVGDNYLKLLEATNDRDYTLDANISVDGRNLINQMLNPDPYTRITIQQIRNYRWVIKGYNQPPHCHLPAHAPINELDSDIIAKLCYFGIRPDVAIYNIKRGKACQEVTMYHTLLKRRLDDQQRLIRSINRGRTLSIHNSSPFQEVEIRRHSVSEEHDLVKESLVQQLMDPHKKLSQPTGKNSKSTKVKKSSSQNIYSPLRIRKIVQKSIIRSSLKIKRRLSPNMSPFRVRKTRLKSPRGSVSAHSSPNVSPLKGRLRREKSDQDLLH